MQGLCTSVSDSTFHIIQSHPFWIVRWLVTWRISSSAGAHHYRFILSSAYIFPYDGVSILFPPAGPDVR